MNDKARELLEEALFWFENNGYCWDLCGDIRTFLAEPVEKNDKFIRLTEVEVLALMNRDIHGYSLICAVENLLADKNNARS